MTFTGAQVITPQMSGARDDAISYDALGKRVTSVTARVFICDDLTVNKGDEHSDVVGVRG